MRTFRLLLAASLLTAGCGAMGSREPGAGRPTAVGSGTPMSQPSEIRRTGGIAGFDDRLTLAPDGTATLTTRGGQRQSCRLPAPLLDRLRSIRWDDLPAAPQPSGRSDVMVYVVTAGARTTTLDADVPPVGQVEAVNSVAALFATISACPPAP